MNNIRKCFYIYIFLKLKIGKSSCRRHVYLQTDFTKKLWCWDMFKNCGRGLSDSHAVILLLCKLVINSRMSGLNYGNLKFYRWGNGGTFTIRLTTAIWRRDLSDLALTVSFHPAAHVPIDSEHLKDVFYSWFCFAFPSDCWMWKLVLSKSFKHI